MATTAAMSAVVVDAQPPIITPAPDQNLDTGDIEVDIQVKELSFDENAPWLPELPEEDPPITCYNSVRKKIWLIFEEPETSKMSFLVNIYVIFLILTSAVVTVCETAPTVHKRNMEVWFGLELMYVLNFSGEFMLRMWACPSLNNFVQSGMNWVDFVSIAPFYIELILQGIAPAIDLRMLRILRLGRALRLVKLVRYSSGMQMITATMAASMDALQLFSFILVALVLVCASAIYYCERGELDDCWEERSTCVKWYRTNQAGQEGLRELSPYQSIPGSIWWVLVTLTTVGYGDVYPVTYFGQLVGLVTQLLGVITLALPLSIIGSNFHEVREKVREANDAKAARAKREFSEDGVLPTEDMLPFLPKGISTWTDPGAAVDDIGEVVDEVDEIHRVLAPMCKAVQLMVHLGARSPVTAPIEVSSETESGSTQGLAPLLDRGQVHSIEQEHMESLEGFVDSAMAWAISLRSKLG